VERTEDKGLGLLRDRDAIYQRDANGKVILDGSNKPILITTDKVEQARLEYVKRGAISNISYDDFYPSGAATFTITPQLLLRAGLSTSIGRPDFSNIIPNIVVDEDSAASPGQPGGSLSLRNPKLKPWSSTNFDIDLEYYFKDSGVFSVGFFKKNITDAFGTFTYVLDQNLINQFELSQEYLGWEMTTKFNAGDAKVTGYEVNYQQNLTMLPAWGRGITIFANGTVLDLDGTRADFSGFIEKSANWGVSYSRGPIGLRLNWAYRGNQHISNQSFAPDAVGFLLPRLIVDANMEYRFNKYFNIFLNARNLNKYNLDRVKESSNSPARLYIRNIYSTKFTAGIRGSF